MISQFLRGRCHVPLRGKVLVICCYCCYLVLSFCSNQLVALGQHYYHYYYYLDLCLSYKYKRVKSNTFWHFSLEMLSQSKLVPLFLLDRDTITSYINNILDFTKASNGDPVIKIVQICTFLIICVTFVCFRCRWTWSFDPIFGTCFVSIIKFGYVLIY